MSPATLHLVARAHAVAAWIATAALAVAIPLWIRARRSRAALAISAVAAIAVTIAGGLGVLLEATYRARIRQRLFVQSPALGWLFERKEHLAFGAIVLAWCTLSTMVAARLTRDPQRARDLDAAARLAAIAAAGLALAASVMAAIVARRAHF
ncbi:MAG: hypothetical protein ABJE95_36525 [Byssovorax sp.]